MRGLWKLWRELRLHGKWTSAYMRWRDATLDNNSFEADRQMPRMRHIEDQQFGLR
jgi:hypothetical protein